MYLLGYDIGSSSIKTAIVNAYTHEVVDSIQYPSREMDMISRQVGWAEQQPELWWQHLCQSTRKILSKNRLNPKLIKGIGISYQMHGLVLVDKDLQVLRPSIIWCDSRAASYGKQAFEDLGHEFCLQNYLNSPGNFTASKLKWVKDNEPDVYSKIYKILLPGDYIAMKLTGNVSTTISGLSEGIFWNFKERKIADQVLNYFGFEQGLLADVTSTFHSVGSVTKDASIQTGLAVGTPITYRAGDQPNNAVALNVLNNGEIAATSGTSGVVYGVVDKPLYDIKSRINAFAHVNYEENHDRIGILLCINGAGIQYAWIKQQIARNNQTYEDMDRMASTVPVGAEGICVLPFGNGSERIFEDRNLGAHIFNLRFNRHTRAHLFRASLEGVAFTFVHGINLLKEMGLKVDVIRVAKDNMFQSRVFAMTIATLLGSHIEVVETTGAVGAALASGVGAGSYNSLEEALAGVRPTAAYEPSLNYSLCSQAYSYWEANLNQMLNQDIQASGKAKLYKSQRDNLEKQLKEKSKTIAIQTNQLASKNLSLSEIRDELQSIVDSEKDFDSLKEKVKRLTRKLSNQFDNENYQETFETHFDVLADDFFKSLKKECPKLSYEEMKLCSFLKLRLSTKEIALKMNLSVRGVETKRYRLRKKLNLPKGKHLIDFLEKI